MKKVSIIVPLYKSERYLPKLLNSILEQTYTNLEGKRSIASTCSSTPFSAIIVSHYTESKKLSTQLF